MLDKLSYDFLLKTSRDRQLKLGPQRIMVKSSKAGWPPLFAVSSINIGWMLLTFQSPPSGRHPSRCLIAAQEPDFTGIISCVTPEN